MRNILKEVSTKLTRNTHLINIATDEFVPNITAIYLTQIMYRFLLKMR